MKCEQCGANSLKNKDGACGYCGSASEPVAEREIINSDMGKFDRLINTELVGDMNTIKYAEDCIIRGNMNKIKLSKNITVIGDMNKY